MTETLTYRPDSTSHLTYIHSLKDSKYRVDIEIELAPSEYEALKRIVRGGWTRKLLLHCRDEVKNALYNVRCDFTRGLCTPSNVDFDVTVTDYEDDILDIRGITNGTRPKSEPLPPPLGCA